MMQFTRTLFALFMMGLIATALFLAALSWVESRPASDMTTIERTVSPPVELAER